jgi:hypothetical protein
MSDKPDPCDVYQMPDKPVKQSDAKPTVKIPIIVKEVKAKDKSN